MNPFFVFVMSQESAIFLYLLEFTYAKWMFQILPEGSHEFEKYLDSISLLRVDKQMIIFLEHTCRFAFVFKVL